MSESENLYQSYRQSLRELWCIAAAWGILAIWNISAGAILAFNLPEPGEPISTILGMPRWICFTVLFPWVAGDIFIVWFALRFMKDSNPETVNSEEVDES